MNTPAPEHQTFVSASAGAQLRAYRESAQLTVDDVAHHLKLARRQVLAIENDELDALPGPTFVRGFIRNYARLLRVDAAPLLEASGLTTASASATSIEHIAPTMGELPADNAPGTSWTRWIIPAGLVLLLAGGIAYYEFGNVAPGIRKARKEAPAEIAAPAPAVPTEPDAISPPATGGEALLPAPPGTQATPAPLAGQTSAPAAPSPATAVAAPGAAPATLPMTGPPSATPSAPGAPVGSGAAAPAAGAGASTSTPTPAGSGHVDLAFTGPSWVEVRDAHGNVLLSRQLDASQTRSLTGPLPLTVTIGNARAARLQFDGAPVDLRPYTQREVARLTLPPRR